jgi:hypothetical protein
MRTRWTLLLPAMAFALGACSPSRAGDSQSSPSPVSQDYPTIAHLSTISPESPAQLLPLPTIQGENTQMAPALPTPYAPGLQSLVERAREDLANRFSIPLAEISVAATSEVTWPDSGLGCQQTGVASVQVLTPGYLILLEYNNNQYEYHANKGSHVTYCMNPTSPEPGSPNE